MAVDPEDASFIMTAVPESKPLIEQMEIGSLAGLHLKPAFEFLAEFHSESAKSPRLMDEFANRTFRDFKFGLQYENIARDLPRRQSEIVLGCVAAYRDRHDCITYGDMNSRNILAEQSNGSIYMIDFEQVHAGAPEYDLAYILSEFLISALYHKNPEIIHCAMTCSMRTSRAPCSTSGTKSNHAPLTIWRYKLSIVFSVPADNPGPIT